MADTNTEESQEPQSEQAEAQPAGDAPAEESAASESAPEQSTEAGEQQPAGEASAEAAPAAGKAAAAAEAAKAKFKALGAMGKGAAGKLKQLLLSIVSFPLLLVRGDLGTRLLLLGFLASIVLVALAGSRILKKVIPVASQSEHRAGTGMNAFLEKEKELALATANLVYLEGFSGVIETKAGHTNTIGFELFAEADSPETSSLFKSRLTEAREWVANAIPGQSYEELMTDEGKEKFRRYIAAHLNKGLREKWHSKGKIEKVFFTRFIMGESF